MTSTATPRPAPIARRIALRLVAILVGVAAPGLGWTAEPARTVDFNFEVLPLLSDRCFTCHGPDERGRKGKLRLDTRDGLFAPRPDGSLIVKPSDPAGSELVKRITTHDADDRMPPADSKLTLSPSEIELLTRWVAQGAPWKRHWSFNPIRKPPVPAVRDTAWPINDLDRFVLARLEAQAVQPAPPAPRARLLRRAALDLTGLPPSPEQLDAFERDPSPNAFETAVEALLDAPAYGEHMAADWLDVARYADTYGYQADVDRDMSPWRDWVIRAFNSNLPYDDFIRWQIAGDLLPQASREQQLATAFNRLHRQTNEGGSIEEEFRSEYVADRVHTFGTAFLGLTLECARCHDHKYDPISQRDYYSLAAFFNNIDESGLYSHFTQATPSPTLLLYPEGVESEHRALKQRLAAAERQVATAQSQDAADFAAWLRSTPPVRLPQPIAFYDFDVAGTNGYANARGTNTALRVDNPEIVPAPDGSAVRFSGDNSVICRNTGHFGRTQPFSIALQLQRSEAQPRAVVLHHSRAWTDSASRGYELVLDQGRPAFALIHFWPGNAIAVRARDPLPTNRWQHVLLTYDGSSRAAGLAIYVEGQRVPTEILRDNLFKDILHRAEWGDADAGNIHLTLGGRFRDSGFKNGSIDNLAVFDSCLSPLEASFLPSLASQFGRPDPLEVPADRIAAADPSTLRAHYNNRLHPASLAAFADVQKLREQENTLVNRIREIMVMQELPNRRPSFVLRRGAYDAPGDPVEPTAPAGILPFPAHLPRNRLGLAEWLVDPQNPLTARLAVNRAWKMHFGRGLTPTLEDLGSQGRLPSHPELLDWLASWFIENGWNRKALHRLIVTSATYRQSSSPPTTGRPEIADPDNVLLASGPKYRLQAEQIRDSALFASGLLTRELGGPSVKPYQPAKLWEESGTGKSYTQDTGRKLYRRSLYTFWRRTAPPPSMLTFDATTREVCTARREATTTPLQALVLLNDPQFVEASRVLAEHAFRSHPTDPAAQSRFAFRALLSRSPADAELAVLNRLREDQQRHFAAHAADAAQLLKVGASTADPNIPPVELAAATVVVSALMNHDEFVVRR